MIYKLSFEDGRVDWCTAKDVLHLLKSYDADSELDLQEIKYIDEISEEEAKKILVINTDWDEDNPEDMDERISLYELGGNDLDFQIIASTEFD